MISPFYSYTGSRELSGLQVTVKAYSHTYMWLLQQLHDDD